MDPSPPQFRGAFAHDRRRAKRSLLFAICVFFVGACGQGGDPERQEVLRGSAAGYFADGAFRGEGEGPQAPPNLVLVVIDTLRRDAAAVPGEPARLMPTLERLAEEGVSFAQAAAPSTWTIPSLGSLLTGLLPLDHGCLGLHTAGHLPEATTTFAEALSAAWGYETAIFSDGPWLREAKGSIFAGFNRGSRGTDPNNSRGQQLDAGFSLHHAADSLDAWLTVRDPKRPYFLLLHSFEAHDPYGPENDSPRGPGAALSQAATQRAIDAFDIATAPTAAERVRRYLTDIVGREALFRAHGPSLTRELMTYMASGDDGEGVDPQLAAELHTAYERGVRHVDKGLAVCLEALASRGLLDERTLLVVTADHGEAFGEHGTLGHGQHLYDEGMRIPLVMRGPAPFRGGHVVQSGVGLIDLLPTFFDWAALPALRQGHGRSLLPLLGSAPDGPAEAATTAPQDEEPRIAHLRVSDGAAGPDVVRLSLAARTSAWKFILERDDVACTVREYLFDLRNDPAEKVDLLSQSGAAAPTLPANFEAAIQRLRARLDEWPCANTWPLNGRP